MDPSNDPLAQQVADTVLRGGSSNWSGTPQSPEESTQSPQQTGDDAWAQQMTQQVLASQQQQLQNQGPQTTATGAFARQVVQNLPSNEAAAQAIGPGMAVGAKVGSFISSFLPGAAEGAAEGALVPVAGETGLGELAGGVIGGLGSALAASTAASALQRKAIQTIAPDAAAKLDQLNAADQQQHPVASSLGSIASSLASFDFSPQTSQTAISSLYKAARGGALTEVEKDAIKTTAAQVGLGVGQAVVTPYVFGQSPTKQGIAEAFVQSLILGHPRYALFGPKAVEGIAQEEAAKTTAANNPVENPANTYADAEKPPGLSDDEMAKLSALAGKVAAGKEFDADDTLLHSKLTEDNEEARQYFVQQRQHWAQAFAQNLVQQVPNLEATLAPKANVETPAANVASLPANVETSSEPKLTTDQVPPSQPVTDPAAPAVPAASIETDTPAAQVPVSVPPPTEVAPTVKESLTPEPSGIPGELPKPVVDQTMAAQAEATPTPEPVKATAPAVPQPETPLWRKSEDTRPVENILDQWRDVAESNKVNVAQTGERASIYHNIRNLSKEDATAEIKRDAVNDANANSKSKKLVALQSPDGSHVLVGEVTNNSSTFGLKKGVKARRMLKIKTYDLGNEFGRQSNGKYVADYDKLVKPASEGGGGWKPLATMKADATLNGSFATYSTAKWHEIERGLGEVQADAQKTYENVAAKMPGFGEAKLNNVRVQPGEAEGAPTGDEATPDSHRLGEDAPEKAQGEDNENEPGDIEDNGETHELPAEVPQAPDLSGVPAVKADNDRVFTPTHADEIISALDGVKPDKIANIAGLAAQLKKAGPEAVNAFKVFTRDVFDKLKAAGQNPTEVDAVDAARILIYEHHASDHAESPQKLIESSHAGSDQASHEGSGAPGQDSAVVPGQSLDQSDGAGAPPEQNGGGVIPGAKPNPENGNGRGPDQSGAAAGKPADVASPSVKPVDKDGLGPKELAQLKAVADRLAEKIGGVSAGLESAAKQIKETSKMLLEHGQAVTVDGEPALLMGDVAHLADGREVPVPADAMASVTKFRESQARETVAKLRPTANHVVKVFTQAVRNLRALGIRVNLIEEPLGKHFASGEYKDLINGKGNAIQLIRLHMADVAHPGVEDLVNLLHEAGHAVAAKLPVEVQASLHQAIANFTNEALGIGNYREQVGHLPPEKQPWAAQEGRLVESFAQKCVAEGIDPTQARTLAQRVWKVFSDVAHAVYLAVAKMAKYPVSHEMAMKYFEHRMGLALRGEQPMRLLNFLGGPRMKLPDWDDMRNAPNRYRDPDSDFTPGQEHSHRFLINGAELVKDPTKLGLKPNSFGEYNGTQLLGTLMNKLSPMEQDIYRKEGIEKAFSGRTISQRDAVKWMKEHSPKAEVHTYGMGKVSEAKKEYDAMTHDWYDTLPEAQRAAIEQMERSSYQLQSTQKAMESVDKVKLARYRELAKQIASEPLDTYPRATDAYNNVSAHDPEEVKQYGGDTIRIDWLLPHKPGYQSKAELASGDNWKTDEQLGRRWKSETRIHETAHTLGDTGGWAMGQILTHDYLKAKAPHVIEQLGLKPGEKILHIEEVQDNHIRNNHDGTYSLRMEKHSKKYNSWSEANKALVDKYPILKDRQRLTIKAALSHIRELNAKLPEGQKIKRLMLSDAETAMLTEGHDVQAWNDARQRESAYGPKIEPKPDQEPGMRLNYDSILPKIAEELTGSKGERVSLGEHKNAFEQQPQGDSGYLPRVPLPLKPRPNLIFRNADGTPKTDASGRLYPIDSVPDREPMLYGKRYRNPDPVFNPKKLLETKEGAPVGIAALNHFIASVVESAHEWDIQGNTAGLSDAEIVQHFIKLPTQVGDSDLFTPGVTPDSLIADAMKQHGLAPDVAKTKIDDLPNDVAKQRAAVAAHAVESAWQAKQRGASDEARQAVKDGTKELERNNNKLTRLTKDYVDLDYMTDASKNAMLHLIDEEHQTVRGIKDFAAKEGQLVQVLRQLDTTIQKGDLPKPYREALDSLHKALVGGDPATIAKFSDTLQKLAKMDVDWQNIPTKTIVGAFHAIAGQAGHEFLRPLLADTPQARASLATAIAFGKSNSHLLDMLALRADGATADRAKASELLKNLLMAHKGGMGELRERIVKMFGSNLRMRDRMLRLADKIGDLKDRNHDLVDQVARSKAMVDFHQDVFRPVLAKNMAELEKVAGIRLSTFEVAEGAKMPVPVARDSGPEHFEEKKMTFTKEVGKKGVRPTPTPEMITWMKSMQGWLDNKDNQKFAAKYNEVNDALEKLKDHYSLDQHLNIKDSIMVQAIGPLQDKCNQVGTPAARLLGTAINQYSANLTANVRDVTQHGINFEAALDSARKAAGYPGASNQIFWDNVVKPALSELEQNGVKFWGTAKSEPEMVNKALEHAVNFMDLKGNPQAISAMEKLLRIYSHNWDMVVEKGRKLGNLVKDKSDGKTIFRPVIGKAPLTAARSLSNIAENFYREHMAAWSGDAIKPAQAAEDYQKDPAALRTALQKQFTGPVWNWFVKSLAYSHRPQFSAPSKDGVYPLATVENIKKAYESSKDPVTFAENLAALHGQKADGAFVGETLDTFQNFANRLRGMTGDERETVEGGSGGPKGYLSEGRHYEDLPEDWVNYLMTDQKTMSQITHAQGFTSAFGPNGRTFETNLTAAKFEQKQMMDQYEGWRSSIQKENPGLTPAKLEQMIKDKAKLEGVNYQSIKQARTNLSLLTDVGQHFDLIKGQNSSGIIPEILPWTRLLRMITQGTVSGVGTAITSHLVSFEQPVRLLGLSPRSLKMTGDLGVAVLKQLTNSVAQTFGKGVFMDADWTLSANKAGIYDPLNTNWQRWVVAWNHTNTADRNAGPVGHLVGRTADLGSAAFNTDVFAPGARQKALERQANGQPMAATLKPLSFFSTAAEALRIANVVVWGRRFEQMVANGVSHFQEHPADAEDSNFRFTREQLNSFAPTDQEFRFMTQRMADFGMSLEQLARDGLRNAQSGGGKPILSDKATQYIAHMVMNDITLESSLTSRAPFLQTKGLGVAANPMLGWAVQKTYQVARSGREPNGEATSRALRAAFMGYMAILPIGMAAAWLRNKFDEEVLGRKQNISDISQIHDAKSAFMTALDNASRVGTFGETGEVANMFLNDDNVRPLSLDSRVFFLNVVENAFNTARMLYGTTAPMIASGNLEGAAAAATDYQTVLRPFAQDFGGNGMLQNLGAINHLIGKDDAEARASNRISVNNYLRVAGRELNLDVRTYASMLGNAAAPTPIKPFIGQMVLSAYANDHEGFMAAQKQAIREARSEGMTLDEAQKKVVTAFEAQNPLKIVFRTPPTETEYRKLLAQLPDNGKQSVIQAIQLYQHYGSQIGATANVFGKDKSGLMSLGKTPARDEVALSIFRQLQGSRAGLGL